MLDLGKLTEAMLSDSPQAAFEAAHAIEQADFSTVSVAPADYIEFLVDVADWLAEHNEKPAAAQIYTRALEYAGRLTDVDTLLVASTIDRLAECMSDDGQYAVAAQLFTMSLDLTASIEGRDASATKWRVDRCAMALERKGDTEAAAQLRKRFQPPVIPSATGPRPSRRTDGASQTDGEEMSEDFDLVPIHFGTHRDRTGRSNPYDYFRGKRRLPIQLGLAIVSVPKKREIGSLPTPPTWIDERRADPSKYFVIKSIDVFGRYEEGHKSIQDAVSASERKEILFFIHGYNTSFSGALNRAAQLASDLEISGATVLYSWPSRGSVLSYVMDRNEAIEPIILEVKELLSTIVANSGAKRIHLVAHSMGSEFLLRILEKLTDDSQTSKPQFAEVVFASPDVDAADFSARLFRVRPLAERVTVYSSKNDSALRVSQLLNGALRAGATSEDLLRAGADIIDTTEASADFLGHSDYAASALDDLRAVIWLSLKPVQRRILRRNMMRDGVYWVFDSESRRAVSIETFRQTLIWARRLDGTSEALETITRMIKVLDRNPSKTKEKLEHDLVQKELKFLTDAV